MQVCFKYIGFIRRTDNTASREFPVEIYINEEYSEGLKGIEEFSHIIVIYHLHLTQFDGRLLREKSGVKVGVFATRSQNRPNPIGISIAELIQRKDNILIAKGINAYNGTPVLDLKPYDKWDSVTDIRVPAWHDIR
ncbi:tRNA (N6-threonylcarbamoyladenosine(37)-N6)-methyltransferase TrmO [Sulfolobus sp. A20]|uniref:tRNA (N6-threonylcarbamoyladenosine(37)-N6)-methyltransferase TrmO n=1 Tax=Saccharolobus sp. A20 TaxID=1891280 RepID=UPI0008460A2D|nr:tRNA (N6-threonylcarbamoyladenosine(37)-N6)-methyltransferase TrmO [Sulfolobus sp. A20]TRM76837.1 tRNA (N6-threonylcarbamoyladenosine(37)-N6)-methyltransferase TrmO [Sulfolobus sp. E5]TRM77245.1 tRNA (N6-threonylcarbamoyladenosine(37)-N6)-methyltransferase TrmO [Sulfolobus sp. A20-N-F8]TRM84264.1 tRNA (N6-threonylcarbamoyladenosine(37)-N6)-methyltransferase TrmO [Sulfolobus sp. A20-N-F6]TRN02721.1 tRNA (N6-threonylcarbamoyladenosine(37)-N6)-methyltransferase TrmO [Sulfolobus sp. F1]TRN04737